MAAARASRLDFEFGGKLAQVRVDAGERVEKGAVVARLVPVIQAELDRCFPGAQICLGKFGQRPPTRAEIQYELYGPNSERMRRTLQAHPDVLHTRITMPRGEPRLHVQAHEPEACACNPAAVAEAVLGTGRHLLSTTRPTIGGFLPLLLLTGGNFWPSLAVVLAGDMAGAMLLALAFTPAL